MNLRAVTPARAAIGALALSSCAVGACRRAPAVGSLPAPSASAVPALAALTFEPPAYDFGTVVQGDAVARVFALSNVGCARLELERSTEALGCTGELVPPLLEPGAAGELRVACRPEFYGPLQVTLPVRKAQNEEQVGQVELTASVTPLLAFDTPLVDLHMPFGEERTVEVHVRGALADGAELTFEGSGDDSLSVTLLPAVGGASPGLRVRAKGKAVGVHVGSITLGTNLARPRVLSLPFSSEVVGSLSVTPSTPYFDLKAPGAASRQIAVRSSQPGFSVSAARVVEGPFSASLSRGAPGEGYTVTVAVDPERIAPEAHGSLGRLLILSNDRAEPEKELPLFAFGAR